ncbi:hypothetical protein C8Q80DRAFT_433197 [Daedaleopsis nitida]|nr:hypothetical protein C8Q80DRAFT_433197 [Daedaleopsis nitida]
MLSSWSPVVTRRQLVLSPDWQSSFTRDSFCDALDYIAAATEDILFIYSDVVTLIRVELTEGWRELVYKQLWKRWMSFIFPNSQRLGRLDVVCHNPYVLFPWDRWSLMHGDDGDDLLPPAKGTRMIKKLTPKMEVWEKLLVEIRKAFDGPVVNGRRRPKNRKGMARLWTENPLRHLLLPIASGAQPGTLLISPPPSLPRPPLQNNPHSGDVNGGVSVPGITTLWLR